MHLFGVLCKNPHTGVGTLVDPHHNTRVLTPYFLNGREEGGRKFHTGLSREDKHLLTKVIGITFMTYEEKARFLDRVVDVVKIKINCFLVAENQEMLLTRVSQCDIIGVKDREVIFGEEKKISG